MILPCDDEPLELIAEHRPRLVELGYQPIATDDDVVRAMLDKERTYEIADELGVERPRSRAVRGASEAETAADEIGYPCALKPLSSHLWARHFPLTTKALIAGNRGELRQALTRIEGIDVDLMVTELIPGGDDQYWSYFSYLDDQGQALFDATKHKLRQYPPGYGQSTYNVLEWNAAVAVVGKRFLQGAGVRGPAYVEFKLDPRDRRFKLIECNHRFVGPNELLLRGGVDLPLLTYNRLIGLPDPPLGPIQWGIGIWSPFADTRAFLAARRQGDLTFWGWLRTLPRRVHGPILSWRDPIPTLARFARRVGQKLLSRRAG